MMAVNKTSKGNQIMTTSDQPESKNQSILNSVRFYLLGFIYWGSLTALFLLISILIPGLSAQPEKPIGFGEGCFYILFLMLFFAFIGYAIFGIVQLISNTINLFTRYLIAVFGFLFSLILPASLAAIDSSFLGLFAPIIAVFTIIAKIVKYKFTKDMPKWINTALDIFIPGAIASGLATLYVFVVQKLFPTIEFINLFDLTIKNFH
jgi:hypothetical protein